MKWINSSIVVLMLASILSCKSSKMPPRDETSEKEMVVEASDKAADMRLHDIWVLDNINGQKADLQSYSIGLPQMEIFVDEQRIGGHDGCNRIMGSIETSGDVIRFGTLASTMMACPEMKGSDDFRAQLDQQTFNFIIKSNRLILNTENGQSLIFKKID